VAKLLIFFDFIFLRKNTTKDVLYIASTLPIFAQNQIIMSVKIAIVENEIHLCHALKLVINAVEDFECVHTYTNGEDALRFLPQNPPDIVLMDIDLGERRMTGIECIARLREMCPKTQFMILTIYEDHQKSV
jgi:DNA-binding NarL/FixJ family response regulator